MIKLVSYRVNYLFNYLVNISRILIKYVRCHVTSNKVSKIIKSLGSEYVSRPIKNLSLSLKKILISRERNKIFDRIRFNSTNTLILKRHYEY